MFFATRDIKKVEEFWWTYFMMTTNMKDYFLKENEDEVRKVFRDTMEIPYIMKKIKINFYRNKMIIAKKEVQIIKNYKDPMLNYKIN